MRRVCASNGATTMQVTKRNLTLVLFSSVLCISNPNSPVLSLHLKHTDGSARVAEKQANSWQQHHGEALRSCPLQPEIDSADCANRLSHHLHWKCMYILKG